MKNKYTSGKEMLKDLKNNEGSFVITKNSEYLADSDTENMMDVYNYNGVYGVCGELFGSTDYRDCNSYSDDELISMLDSIVEYELINRDEITSKFEPTFVYKKSS